MESINNIRKNYHFSKFQVTNKLVKKIFHVSMDFLGKDYSYSCFFVTIGMDKFKELREMENIL